MIGEAKIMSRSPALPTRTGQSHMVTQSGTAAATSGGGSVSETNSPSCAVIAACADTSDRMSALSGSAAASAVVLRTSTVILNVPAATSEALIATSPATI